MATTATRAAARQATATTQATMARPEAAAARHATAATRVLEQRWLDLEQQRLQQRRQQQQQQAARDEIVQIIDEFYGPFQPWTESEMRHLWEQLQCAKRRAGGIGHPFQSDDEMMHWAREQQAEVEIEAYNAGAQHIQPPPEGGDSGRDDGIARPGYGRPNQYPSEDRATRHDDEIVGRCEETLEERESTAETTAPTMAPGAPSREDNKLARMGETSPHARENAPEGAQGQEPLHGKQ